MSVIKRSKDKKYNLIVPLAGRAQRMINGGYTIPKPLIFAGERRIIEYGLDSIDYSDCNLIFVLRKEHVQNFAIDKYLYSKYGNEIALVVIDVETEGALSTCLLAEDYINNDIPLIVFTSDVYFEPKFIPSSDIFSNDGHILTFFANSSNYSYVKFDQVGNVVETAEKKIISNDAAVGLFCFKTGAMFVEAAKHAQNSNLKTNNEFYICPLYNLLVREGKTIKSSRVSVLYVMG
nr:hypothetical protein [Pseudomonadota bacterium]